MKTVNVYAVADIGGRGESEPAPVKESWHPQARRGTVTSCRFMVFWRGRWRRLYSDSAAAGVPHFIRDGGDRVPVDGVAP
jgi:hypothetical protein